MSWREAAAPECRRRTGTIDLVIEPRSRDLGGFSVRRVLPSGERKMVGPFIFFDEMGPADFPPGEGINVRPHPHIGLATVTYLFEGEILHRDSLGFVQPIRPGAINLMTAGRGIVHSERTPPALLAAGQKLHGIQIWMALPQSLEEIDASFEHYAADRLPVFEAPGAHGTVIIGSAYGFSSPVRTHAETLYLHIDAEAGASIALPQGVPELGVYVVQGEVVVDGFRLRAHTMGVLHGGMTGTIEATSGARLIVAGGEHLGDREIWWNFVSSSRARIEEAKSQWRQAAFDPVPGDDEFIPLPDES
jgi:redox-sensitive bicupin YhaK (pirin superfamily)